MNSFYRHAHLESHVSIVAEALQEFAQQLGESPSNWRYSLNPPIRGGEAQTAVMAYRWIGSIINTSFNHWLDEDLDSPILDANRNYLVTWDFARPSILGGYKVFVLKYYSYYSALSRITNYFLIEVGKWARPTRVELDASLLELYKYLHSYPVLLKEIEPADDYTKLLSESVELTVREVARYR